MLKIQATSSKKNVVRNNVKVASEVLENCSDFERYVEIIIEKCWKCWKSLQIDRIVYNIEIIA